MKTRSHLALLAAALFSFGCGDDHDHDHPHPHPGDEPAAGAAGAGGHTESTALGSLTLGAYEIEVVQMAAVVAGAEGDFDLLFPGGEVPAEAVRGWLGDESGTGARKARFEKEAEGKMHGHPEAPAELTDGVRLWIEIEGAGKAGLDFRR